MNPAPYVIIRPVVREAQVFGTFEPDFSPALLTSRLRPKTSQTRTICFYTVQLLDHLSVRFSPTSMEKIPIHRKPSKKTEKELDIRIIIGSRYRVFDRSGKLSMSLVFSLCRYSSEDTDPRPLILQANNSVLDVPYALSQGLLHLSVLNKETKQNITIDTNDFRSEELDPNGKSQCTLSSPVGRKGNWREHLVTYNYFIDPNSALASLFDPRKTYTIRIAKGCEFGGQYIYSDLADDSAKQSDASSSKEDPKVVCRKAEGRATFTAVPSLAWPPKVRTHLRWAESEGNQKLLEVKVSNMGTKPIMVETRGHQHYCIFHYSYMEAYEHKIDSGYRRIIDATGPAPGRAFQVIDVATQTIIREARTPIACGSAPPRDLRPKLQELTTLNPDQPLIRQIDITGVLSRLPDGIYGLRMVPRGMWWCVGNLEDLVRVEGDDHVPWEMVRDMVPPVMLECEEVPEVQIKNGVIVDYS